MSPSTVNPTPSVCECGSMPLPFLLLPLSSLLCRFPLLLTFVFLRLQSSSFAIHYPFPLFPPCCFPMHITPHPTSLRILHPEIPLAAPPSACPLPSLSLFLALLFISFPAPSSFSSSSSSSSPFASRFLFLFPLHVNQSLPPTHLTLTSLSSVFLFRLFLFPFSSRLLVVDRGVPSPSPSYTISRASDPTHRLSQSTYSHCATDGDSN